MFSSTASLTVPLSGQQLPVQQELRRWVRCMFSFLIHFFFFYSWSVCFSIVMMKINWSVFMRRIKTPLQDYKTIASNRVSDFESIQPHLFIVFLDIMLASMKLICNCSQECVLTSRQHCSLSGRCCDLQGLLWRARRPEVPSRRSLVQAHC